MNEKAKREGSLSIPMKFDEAIKRTIAVKPPLEGWTEYEKRVRALSPKASSKVKKPKAP
jgi:hypothetical protein